VSLAKERGRGFRQEWRDSCITNHSSWEYKFWDMQAAVELLEARYPWYLQFFHEYEKRVSQGE
jgi:hypothetical protein